MNDNAWSKFNARRHRVIQTLMQMDCIPAGMELFPAIDEEQFEFIKRVIDDCDYYLLIIGGRYGSLAPEGVSYTEKEYNYAIEKGLKVIALVHGEPNQIPAGKTDRDAALAESLAAFRGKVTTGRLVRYWNTAADLPGIVSLSLIQTIKAYPAPGWVRGGSSASTEILEELNAVRKQNEELRTKLAAVQPPMLPRLENLAGLEDTITIGGSYTISTARRVLITSRWEKSLSFANIFSLIAPYLLEYPTDQVVQHQLPSAIVQMTEKNATLVSIDSNDFQTIKIQLTALGLIDTRYVKSPDGRLALFWNLTPSGHQVMMELRAIRKQQPIDASTEADMPAADTASTQAD